MHALLKLLEADPRATPASLAKQLNRPEEEVSSLLKELEEKRVILGYAVIVDNDKADRETVQAAIEVKITPERDGGFDRIANRIARYPEVTSCYLMSGGYDLLVIIHGKTMKEVAMFVSEKLATVGGVLSTATHFMLKPYKERGVLLVNEGTQERLSITP